MKSKQSLFQQIISVSIKKVRERSVAGEKGQFEQRMKCLPTKIKQLNVYPYMFIFEALIAFPDEVDFVLTQYQKMIQQNFLNPNSNSKMLTQHFRNHLNNHSFRIIQTLMDIKDPNIQFFQLFFQIHNSIAMPQNILQAFKYTGYKWLVRAFAFKKYPRPAYIDQLFLGILKVEDRNLPTVQEENKVRSNYISKIISNMVITVQNNLKSEAQRVQSKYGFCFVCCKPADYYCKDTKIPVCGPDCKKLHIKQITDSSCIDFQYTQNFKDGIQKLLYSNLRMKKNVSISIQYLCNIYMNSDFVPKQSLPHKDLFTLPVIVQRVWLLYTMYHLKRNEVFQHIIADCLKSKLDYVYVNSAKYFLKIAESPHIIQVYQFLDCYGFRRIIPIILNNLHEQEQKIKFIYCLIDRVYQDQKLKNVSALADLIQKQASLQSSLLRAINFEKNPLQNFKQVFSKYDETQCTRQMMRFIIKNEQKVNKSKICDIILINDIFCKIFLQQLLVDRLQADSKQTKQKGEQQKERSKQKGRIRLKSSNYLDQILRQMFFFLNIKISDKIYHLLQLLCQVLDLSRIQSSGQSLDPSEELQVVFNSQNTATPDTMFQFAYFIIMIVTQLHQNVPLNGSSSFDKNKDKKKVTETEFLNRVKSFDSKFAQNQRNYIIGVYYRLVQQPFSQQTRGILSQYPKVKKQKNPQTAFHPIRILLDNWEVIYESLSNYKNQVHTLSRCCSNLSFFPTICQPFFQLLLNKLTNQQPGAHSPNQIQGRTVKPNIQNQDHLLLYINNLLQFSPNCVGHSSWEYLFLRDAQKNYLFELSSLIYLSNSLTLSNFIWFIKCFCSNVKISQNLEQCLKLLSYNYKKASTAIALTSEQKSRLQIINKQYAQQLFINQKSDYYQMQFIKGVFEIGNFELAIVLLDITQINIVSQKLIIDGLIEIVEKNWTQIENYGANDKTGKKQVPQQLIELDEKSKSRGKQAQKQGQGRQPHVCQYQSYQINKIWMHILNKAITIGINSPQHLEQFCLLLHSIPDLIKYFQILNIEHAIACALEGRLVVIDYSLTRQLQRFQQHISQMYSAKFSIMSRNRLQRCPGLLDQFVCVQNIECIIQHFKYFFQIEQLYHILVETILQKIIRMFKKVEGPANKEQHIKQNQEQSRKQMEIDIYNYDAIIKVLKDNNYINLMKLESRLQPVIGFVAILTKYLQILIRRKEKQGRNHKGEDKLESEKYLSNLKKTMSVYLEQFQSIVKQIVIPNIDLNNLNRFAQSNEQQGQEQERSSIYEHFVFVYNILASFLNPHYILSIQLFGLLDPSLNRPAQLQTQLMAAAQVQSYYRVPDICGSIHIINNQLKYRFAVFQLYCKYYVDIGLRLPPGLLQQEYMSTTLAILFCPPSAPPNKQLKQIAPDGLLINLAQLKKVLQVNLGVYKKLIEQIHKDKNKGKNVKKPRIFNNASLNPNQFLSNSLSLSSTANVLKKNKTIESNPSDNITHLTQSNVGTKPVQKTSSNSQLNASSEQSLQKQNQKYELSNYEQQLYNQKIACMKRILTLVCDVLSSRIQHFKQQNQPTDLSDGRAIKDISILLVEYLQLGFDFYCTQTQTFQFKNKDEKAKGKSDREKQDAKNDMSQKNKHANKNKDAILSNSIYRLYQLLNGNNPVGVHSNE